MLNTNIDTLIFVALEYLAALVKASFIFSSITLNSIDLIADVSPSHKNIVSIPVTY
ncbi:hypothetical protein [uncultured Clostridium sp.]|uniref:hypothetical protein n=1 Tax=uncultured Clostridium sp. TaxID=59620 RepID=UPI00272BAA5F|nr:hypothetical protein [uncultured Clostridium sp.]